MPVLSLYRNQSIDFSANQLAGFYLTATLAFNELTHIVPMFLFNFNSSLYFPDLFQKYWNQGEKGENCRFGDFSYNAMVFLKSFK